MNRSGNVYHCTQKRGLRKGNFCIETKNPLVRENFLLSFFLDGYRQEQKIESLRTVEAQGGILGRKNWRTSPEPWGWGTISTWYPYKPKR